MSKNIKKIRAALGMTQASLAKAIKVPILTISAWETGRQLIAAPMAIKVSVYATSKGVLTTLDDIYGMTKEKKK